ncbi:MAG: hypothetical protein HQK67_06445, partial [Desulfamplus sp.]|nr:hypothetical protein [Desulfamplus sp.]
HKAFIEHLIDKSGDRFALHNNLVSSYDKWLVKYSGKLEGIICHILENHGKPMHFTEIAEAVRQISPKHEEISDHNVHASIIRYDTVEIVSRGTYGLKSWGMGGYRSVSTAIEELLDASNRPLKRAEVIELLDGQFTEGNITSALGKDTRFISIGEGFYDRPEKWQQRKINDFIDLLPEPVAEFARYLVSKNNCSYKLVLALVFIRGMDSNGAFCISTLKERFFSYYLSRKKKGLVVEADNVTISKINSIEDGFIRSATNKPIDSFLNSIFFIRNNTSILLQSNIVDLLSNTTTHNLLIIILLKAIDDYFLQLSSSLSFSAISDNQTILDNPAFTLNNSYHLEKEPKKLSQVCSYNDDCGDEDDSFSISIKTRDKAKIKI